MALGGWRVGFARMADGPLGEEARAAVAGVAGAVWSALAQPMQAVARARPWPSPTTSASGSPAARALHRAVTAAAYREVTAAGIDCRRPSGALLPLSRPRGAPRALARRRARPARELAEHLLERHDVGVLAGEAFGDEPAGLRVRMATSLCTGRRRRAPAALRRDDPASLRGSARARPPARRARRLV
jgi:aspartate aminotransferase